MAIPEELITFKEAQEYLGISKAKMGRLAKEGSLPIYIDPLDKRKKLVPRAEVEKLKQPQAVKKETPVVLAKPAAVAEVKEPEPAKPTAEVEKPPENKEPSLKRMASCKCIGCGERFRTEFEWLGQDSRFPERRPYWIADCPKCGARNTLERPNWAPPLIPNPEPRA